MFGEIALYLYNRPPTFSPKSEAHLPDLADRWKSDRNLIADAQKCS